MNFYRFLKRGMSGHDVAELQEELKKIGLYDIVIDGSFGPATEKAVRDFQSSNNLVVDGIVGPATVAKFNEIANKIIIYKTKYFKINNTHIIETTPDNIEIRIIGDTLRAARKYGINGTFFDTPRPQLPNSCWGIATNNGKAIGGNSMLVSYNKEVKRGTIVYYEDESLEVVVVNNINEFKKPHIWAISGYSVYPYLNFKEEKMPGGINYRTNHTYIGYRGNLIYLIVKPYHMINEILPLIKMLNLEGCIVLDGGGSTQLRHPRGSFNASRRINSAVLLKEI